MKIFSIESETNNITIHTTSQGAEAVANAERFRNEAGLVKIAANWPASRLVEIWNSLPGETPVKRFKDRATAVSRIWKAIQMLDQTASAATEEPAPVPDVTPVAGLPETAPIPAPAASETLQQEAVVSKSIGPSLDTPVALQSPDVAPNEPPAKTKATRAKKAPVTATNAAPREGSKTSQVIAMLKREGGTTLEEIMIATKWQKHTTRAVLSAGGSLTKNHGLVVTSEKVGDKRTYSIKT